MNSCDCNCFCIGMEFVPNSNSSSFKPLISATLLQESDDGPQLVAGWNPRENLCGVPRLHGHRHPSRNQSHEPSHQNWNTQEHSCEAEQWESIPGSGRDNGKSQTLGSALPGSTSCVHQLSSVCSDSHRELQQGFKCQAVRLPAGSLSGPCVREGGDGVLPGWLHLYSNRQAPVHTWQQRWDLSSIGTIWKIILFYVKFQDELIGEYLEIIIWLIPTS